MRQVYIKANVEQVFQAWVIPNQLERWFIATAHYTVPDGAPRQPNELVRSGDDYHWQWHQDLEVQGKVLKVVENEVFQFTFGTNNDGKAIVVTVTFSYDGDETLVQLSQSNMTDTPADHVGYHLSCNLGWSFFMTNLKALLEHGVDLREKTPERAYATRAMSL